jgi:hypothetical protein
VYYRSIETPNHSPVIFEPAIKIGTAIANNSAGDFQMWQSPPAAPEAKRAGFN